MILHVKIIALIQYILQITQGEETIFLNDDKKHLEDLNSGIKGFNESTILKNDESPKMFLNDQQIKSEDEKSIQSEMTDPTGIFRASNKIKEETPNSPIIDFIRNLGSDFLNTTKQQVLGYRELNHPEELKKDIETEQKEEKAERKEGISNISIGLPLSVFRAEESGIEKSVNKVLDRSAEMLLDKNNIARTLMEKGSTKLLGSAGKLVSQGLVAASQGFLSPNLRFKESHENDSTDIHSDNSFQKYAVPVIRGIAGQVRKLFSFILHFSSGTIQMLFSFSGLFRNAGSPTENNNPLGVLQSMFKKAEIDNIKNDPRRAFTHKLEEQKTLFRKSPNVAEIKPDINDQKSLFRSKSKGKSDASKGKFVKMTPVQKTGSTPSDTIICLPTYDKSKKLNEKMFRSSKAEDAEIQEDNEMETKPEKRNDENSLPEFSN